MRLIHALSGALALFTFALIVLGAWVRVTNSGLSCPDWPTCYGFWAPTPADLAGVPDMAYDYYQVMLEWGHRFLAGVVVGPLTLLIAIAAFFYRKVAPNVAIGAFLALLLVLSQATLGAVTVFEANSPWSVAAHLLNALAFFAAVLFVRERTSPFANAAADCSFPFKAVNLVAIGAALAAMAAAALTSKMGATLECADWPLCDGQLLPADDHAGLRAHLSHRYLALSTAIAIAALYLVGRSGAPLDSPARGPVSWLVVLVIGQALLGGAVILLEAPLWSRLLHQALGVLVFVLLVTTFWRSFGIAAPRSAA